ncbi:inorganic pyrophosphatase TTM2-like [Andrographis paniculata]|uniref:inorganic pyrophosphatase TTM2-like n=1 Tax=Andrographis paniculata TaxID=175694 RepID=UPI0021E7DF78|nr:inorganic pyrophosphatase TTM2-like [Andrographis paniculata]
MATDVPDAKLVQQKTGLLKDQVQLVKRKDCDRYEIAPFPDNLSFAKGFYIVVRALQLLAEKNVGLVLIGLAGPSGSGKTVLAEKILNFIPNIAIISMDNYNDASRIVDGNFDDPRLTDYETLLKNIHDLKAGKQADVPIYDFKTSSRTGYRKVELPSSRIVIIEGIYALSEKLRPFLDLRVSVTGGIHFDLIKRVLRDVNRAGQQPEEIIHQISETVYPMYKAFIEPDLQSAHIRIINKFNPFTGFLCPTYILKSQRTATVEKIKSVMSEEHTECTEQTYDIYLLPPGEDPETCHSYLRMRNKDGKYNLMFEEWVTDHPFVISPRISFEVSVRLLGGLMALGYTIASILKRRSHVFCDERVCVKIDWVEQLNHPYIQVQGRDRASVKHVAEQLGLEGSYTPRTYIEQIQMEKVVDEILVLPDDLKSKLSLVENLFSNQKETLPRMPAKNPKSGMSRSYSTNLDKNMSDINIGFDDRTTDSPSTLVYQRALTQLSQVVSKLSYRMDDFTLHIEELTSNLSSSSSSPTSLLDESLSSPSSFKSGSEDGSPTGHLLPSPKTSSLNKEISSLVRGQRQVMHQVENLCKLIREKFEEEKKRSKKEGESDHSSIGHITTGAIFASVAFGLLLVKGSFSRN